MDNFLALAAQKIIENHPTNLQNVLVLLPSKRGELFLKRALSTHLLQPRLAPAMQTIEEFVQEASGLQKQSNLQLLIALFTVYVDKVNATETFDNFIKWGNMLLHDFNEIDRHLVDPYQLFNNLLDAKTIENWGVEPGQETELMANFLAFWKHLNPLYNAFNAALDAQNLSYQGKAYRKVADDLACVDALLGNKYEGIYLLGFNALNKAEENIFQHMLEVHNAVALWDADAFYMNDPLHEAGDFLRKYKSNWRVFTKHPFTFIAEDIATQAKQIHTISAPSKLGMSAAAGQVLNHLPIEDQLSTAVVLADEAMLLPMLDAVPEAYNAINVTMGLPLKHAPLAQDLGTILRMHEQAERTAASGNSYAFHHRTFLAVIESPLFKSVAGQTAGQITAQITNSNTVFISPKSAQAWLKSNDFVNDAWLQLFAKPENPLQLIKGLDDVLLAHVAETENLNPIYKQAAFTLHQVHGQLHDLLSPIKNPLEVRTLLRLYQSVLAEQQIDFYGEPLAGLQIMGMLETRTLDFKRVIITSLNEGILPAGKSQNSFIPHDLKVHFGLPTHHEKDAVYAYHFYRLLQRAEEIWLIYDSDMKGIGAKEKSRFILQIENEFNALPNVTIYPTLHYTPQVKKESLITVPNYAKDAAVLERLWQMAEKGLSPSALSIFLNDPAQFYVERLLRVADVEEIEETIGYDILGTVVHDSLEEIYTPFLQKVLPADALKTVANVDEIVYRKLEEHYKGNTAQGRNLLIKNVALHMVKQVLAQDAQRIKQLNAENTMLTVLALEEELSCECHIAGLEKPVLFKGIADRIDREGNAIYILDYKTGFLTATEMSCPEGVEQLFEPGKKNKAFQVMFYAWLYHKKHGMPAGGLQAGLFSTRSPSLGFTRLKLAKTTQFSADDLAHFEEKLFEMIKELFNTSKPFAPRFITLDERTES